MSSRSSKKPQRALTTLTRSQWREQRRSPGPLDHETGEGANENDKSMTKAVRQRLHRVYWNLRGEVPPPMDQDGRPLD